MMPAESAALVSLSARTNKPAYASSTTFAAVPFSAGTRIVAIRWRGNGASTAVSIGGVAATKLPSSINTTLYVSEGPAGSFDVQVTGSGAASIVNMVAATATGVVSNPTSASQTFGFQADPQVAAEVVVASGGFAFAVAGHDHDGVPSAISWIGPSIELVETTDQDGALGSILSAAKLTTTSTMSFNASGGYKAPGFAVVSFAPATVTPPASWNPNDKHAGITLSNNNRTAEAIGGSPTDRVVRSIGPLTADRTYVEFQIDGIANSVGVGVSNQVSDTSTFPGVNTNGVIWYSDNGVVTKNVGQHSPFRNGNGRIAFVFDKATQKFYPVEPSGLGSNLSVEPPSGGIRLEGAGPYYLVLQVRAPGDKATLILPPDYAYAVPAGCVGYGTVAPPPTNVHKLLIPTVQISQSETNRDAAFQVTLPLDNALPEAGYLSFGLKLERATNAAFTENYQTQTNLIEQPTFDQGDVSFSLLRDLQGDALTYHFGFSTLPPSDNPDFTASDRAEATFTTPAAAPVIGLWNPDTRHPDIDVSGVGMIATVARGPFGQNRVIRSFGPLPAQRLFMQARFSQLSDLAGIGFGNASVAYTEFPGQGVNGLTLHNYGNIYYNGANISQDYYVGGGARFQIGIDNRSAQERGVDANGVAVPKRFFLFAPNGTIHREINISAMVGDLFVNSVLKAQGDQITVFKPDEYVSVTIPAGFTAYAGAA